VLAVKMAYVYYEIRYNRVKEVSLITRNSAIEDISRTGDRI